MCAAAAASVQRQIPENRQAFLDKADKGDLQKIISEMAQKKLEATENEQALIKFAAWHAQNCSPDGRYKHVLKHQHEDIHIPTLPSHCPWQVERLQMATDKGLEAAIVLRKKEPPQAQAAKAPASAAEDSLEDFIQDW